MFLLLLQLLMILGLGAIGQRGELQRNKRRRIQRLSYQDKDLLEKQGLSELLVEDPMDYEEILEEPSLYVTAQELAAESRMPGEKISSRFILPYMELDVHQDLGSWTAEKDISHSENTRSFQPSHLSNKREAEPPYRKDAKKFWEHFMFKKNSASEGIVLPIKTNEMYQETCKTLPFSQSIVHENCEKVVVQNNLCFGKCSSFHVPGSEDRLYTFCSHCLPTKFTMKRLELNCTRSVVVKTVMIVEECKCENQKIKDSEIGALLSDLQSNVYEHN